MRIEERVQQQLAGFCRGLQSGVEETVTEPGQQMMDVEERVQKQLSPVPPLPPSPFVVAVTSPSPSTAT